MSEFLQALASPEIPFLRYALFAGLLSSAAFGIIGTYVIVRRISYIAAAIAHSVLAGIGLGLYLQKTYNITWFTPLLGAVFAAIVSAFIIGLVSVYAEQREDTVIGAIWAIGMATGIMLLSKTPGYVEPMSYLFGNILIISKTDLLLIGCLDAVVVVTGIMFHNQLRAISFDEEFARVRGVRTNLFYFVMLIMTAITIVLLVTIVGIVMVIALLTLPAGVSGLFSKKLGHMMIFSALFCMVFTVGGLGLSYSYNFPSGSTIILLAGCVYLLSILSRSVLERVRKSKRAAESNTQTMKDA
jgi:zinc transport system permease protein